MSKYIVARELDWNTFSKQHWDQNVVHFKATSANFLEVDTVFQVAAAAGDVLFSSGDRENAKTNVADFTIGKRRQVYPGKWMPHVDDGSFEGYRRRLVRSLGSQQYSLNINSLHSFSFPLWSRQRAFFGELWRRIGLPVTSAITVLFHGNYEYTPVGVHKDRYSTFLFAVAGKKRMRFWSERPWTEPAMSMRDYRRHLGTSFAVDVEPGDILYWPSDYYHVGESCDGGVTTSVNVGIPRTGHSAFAALQDLWLDVNDVNSSMDPSENLMGMLSTLPGPAGHGWVTSPFAKDGTLSPALPDAVERTLRAFRARTRPSFVDRRLRESSLRHLSAAGFAQTPPAAPRRRLRDSDYVLGDPQYPMLWAPDGPRRCVYAANGHLQRVAATSSQMARIAKHLNSGRPAPVGAMGLRPVLENLESFRAIRRVERPSK